MSLAKVHRKSRFKEIKEKDDRGYEAKPIAPPINGSWKVLGASQGLIYTRTDAAPRSLMGLVFTG